MTAADTGFTVTAQDVEQTARDATHAQWTVAGIGMAGSALAAYFAVDHLGENGGVGIITAATADLALIWWLRIAKRLRAAGEHSRSGFVLEVATAIVMFYQNLGAAVFKLVQPGTIGAYWLLGIEHIFIPVLLVVSFVAFDDAAFKLGKVEHQIKSAEKAERDAQRAADQAATDQAAENTQLRQQLTDALTKDQRRDREIARLRADLEQQTAATQTVKEQLAAVRTAQPQPAKPQPAPPVKPARTPADRETRRQWVRDERAAGRKPSGADVDKRFGPPRNGAAVIREVLAEEKKRLHVVGGKR